jgi:hypothetical protein
VIIAVIDGLRPKAAPPHQTSPPSNQAVDAPKDTFIMASQLDSTAPPLAHPPAHEPGPVEPTWFIDEDQRESFEHYLSQFITAHCPACHSRKVFVDGTETPATKDGREGLQAAYFAVCDPCSYVWHRAASPDEVAQRCIQETAAQDAANPAQTLSQTRAQRTQN